VSRNSILKQSTEAQLRGSVDSSKDVYRQEMHNSLQKILTEEEIQIQHRAALEIAIKNFNAEICGFGEGKFMLPFLDSLKMVCPNTPPLF
jgi:hypothetical protein